MTDQTSERLRQAMHLAADGHLYAALERLEALLPEPAGPGPAGGRTGLVSPSGSGSCELQVAVWDEMGKVCMQLGRVGDAGTCFERAAGIAATANPDTQAKVQMHLAMVHHALGNFDRAYRLLADLLEQSAGLSEFRLGTLYNNLATVQWATRFYREAVQNMQRSVSAFTAAGAEQFRGRLYNNIGVCCLELRRYDEARTYLEHARQYEDERLVALFGLCRLYLRCGEFERSLDYAREALRLFQSQVTNVERVKLAHISRLLAELTYQTGDQRTAIRLMEKAELLFGMQDHWSDWSATRSHLQTWLSDPGTPGLAKGDGTERRSIPPAQGTTGTSWTAEHLQVSGESRHPSGSPVPPDAFTRAGEMMEQFLWFIECMNAQELLSPRFAQLVDTRVRYTLALADQLAVPAADKTHLVYAARLCDYGLTALDPEAALAPRRSASAWEQFARHPDLGASMLTELGLHPAVYRFIRRHHERWDGTGFPNGLSAADLDLLDGILQVADAYATAVVWNGWSHTTALRTLVEGASGFHGDVLQAMLAMFQAEG